MRGRGRLNGDSAEESNAQDHSSELGHRRRFSVDLQHSAGLVMIAGGVGITPMISMLRPPSLPARPTTSAQPEAMALVSL